MSGAYPKVTAPGELPDFDLQTVIKSGMTLRDGGRFRDVRREQFNITADCLFPFRERTISHTSAPRARNEARFKLKRLALSRFALALQLIKPRIPAGH
jgi:hypothetical protein